MLVTVLMRIHMKQLFFRIMGDWYLRKYTVFKLAILVSFVSGINKWNKY